MLLLGVRPPQRRLRRQELWLLPLSPGGTAAMTAPARGRGHVRRSACGNGYMRVSKQAWVSFGRH